MSVPFMPLGDLSEYSIRTLEKLADQHLERASEIQRKLEAVVTRGRAIQDEIDRRDRP